MSTNDKLSKLLFELIRSDYQYYKYHKLYSQLKNVISLEACPFYNVSNNSCKINIKEAAFDCQKTIPYNTMIEILNKDNLVSKGEAEEIVKKFEELRLIKICSPPTQSQEDDKTFKRTIGGVVVGSLLGGLVLGPIGFFLGGFTGGLIGYSTSGGEEPKRYEKRIIFLK